MFAMGPGNVGQQDGEIGQSVRGVANRSPQGAFRAELIVEQIERLGLPGSQRPQAPAQLHGRQRRRVG